MVRERMSTDAASVHGCRRRHWFTRRCRSIGLHTVWNVRGRSDGTLMHDRCVFKVAKVVLIVADWSRSCYAYGICRLIEGWMSRQTMCW